MYSFSLRRRVLYNITLRTCVDLISHFCGKSIEGKDPQMGKSKQSNYQKCSLSIFRILLN